MDQMTLDDPSPALDIEELDIALGDLIYRFGYDVTAARLASACPDPVPSAPARTTDPQTSHLAAKRSGDVGRFSRKSTSGKLLALFDHRELTDQQATVMLIGSHAAPSAFDGVRRRCSDLRAAGYLRDSGIRRKNPGSDDVSTVWKLTVAGRDALMRIEESGWSR